MGAISEESSIPVLREYLDDPERTVRETCEIALARIEWDHSEEGGRHHAETNKTKDKGDIPYGILAVFIAGYLLAYMPTEPTHLSILLRPAPVCSQEDPNQPEY